MKFEVGDRVVGTRSEGGVDLRGMTGVIVGFDNKFFSLNVIVEFDKSFSEEHDCYLGLKHGRWCIASSLAHEGEKIDKIGMDLLGVQKIIDNYAHDYRDQKISEKELGTILTQFTEDIITSFLCDYKGGK